VPCRSAIGIIALVERAQDDGRVRTPPTSAEGACRQTRTSLGAVPNAANLLVESSTDSHAARCGANHSRQVSRGSSVAYRNEAQEFAGDDGVRLQVAHNDELRFDFVIEELAKLDGLHLDWHSTANARSSASERSRTCGSSPPTRITTQRKAVISSRVGAPGSARSRSS